MSQVYANVFLGLARAELNLETGPLRMALIDLGLYTPNYSTDDFLSDVPGGAIVATSGNLENVTLNVSGNDLVIDCEDPSFGEVPSGGSAEAILLYRHTGTAATSRLIGLVDEKPNGDPISINPNGSEIIVQVNDGADRLLRFQPGV